MTNEELCMQIQAGDKNAYNELLKNNEALLHSIIRKEYNRYSYLSLEYEDLVSVASIALLRAATKYDPSFECMFTTYAVYRIRHDVQREIYNNGTVIRIPVKEYERAIAQLKDSDINPDCNFDKIENCIISDINKATYTLDIDASQYEDGNYTIGETISYEDEMSPLDAVGSKYDIECALECLSEKERKIIKLIYYDGKNMGEISDEIGVSRSRIHQIKQKAIDKMHQCLCGS